MVFIKKAFDKRGKTIPKGKTKNQTSIENNGRSHKGCRCTFTIKTLYFLPIVIEIHVIMKKTHQCYGNILQGDKVSFVAHVLGALKDFILNILRLGLFVSQVMAKHHRNVQHLVETSGYFTKDTFLCEQDIHNITRKLTKETYNKHDNDVKSVCMWVQEYPYFLFYYQESGLEVGGELIGTNIAFTIEI